MKSQVVGSPRRRMLDPTWGIRQVSAVDCGPAVVARLVRAANRVRDERGLLERLRGRIQRLKWRARYYTGTGHEKFVTAPGQLRNILDTYGLEYTVTSCHDKSHVQGAVQNALMCGRTAAVLVDAGRHWALLHGWCGGVVGVVNPGTDMSYPYAVSYDALWSDDSLLGRPVPPLNKPGYSYDGEWVAVIPRVVATAQAPTSANSFPESLAGLDDSWSWCSLGRAAGYFYQATNGSSPTRYLLPWMAGDEAKALLGFDDAGKFRIAAHGGNVKIGEINLTDESLLAYKGGPIGNDPCWNGFQRVMSLGTFGDCKRVERRWPPEQS